MASSPPIILLDRTLDLTLAIDSQGHRVVDTIGNPAHQTIQEGLFGFDPGNLLAVTKFIRVHVLCGRHQAEDKEMLPLLVLGLGVVLDALVEIHLLGGTAGNKQYSNQKNTQVLNLQKNPSKEKDKLIVNL